MHGNAACGNNEVPLDGHDWCLLEKAELVMTETKKKSTNVFNVTSGMKRHFYVASVILCDKISEHFSFSRTKCCFYSLLHNWC